MCCAADKRDIISVLLLLYEYKYDEQDTQSACYLYIPYTQWCSLVFCSEYTVIFFFLPSLILTHTRAASHKHHHTH